MWLIVVHRKRSACIIAFWNRKIIKAQLEMKFFLMVTRIYKRASQVVLQMLIIRSFRDKGISFLTQKRNDYEALRSQVLQEF